MTFESFDKYSGSVVIVYMYIVLYILACIPCIHITNGCSWYVHVYIHGVVQCTWYMVVNIVYNNIIQVASLQCIFACMYVRCIVLHRALP